MLDLARRGWWMLGAVAIILLILTGSLLPLPEVDGLNSNDKLNHAAAYAALMFWTVGMLRPAWYVVAWAGVVTLGGSVELVQALMGLGRHADWYDFFANLLGASLVLMLAWAGLGGWACRVERALGLTGKS
ncbi:MAG: hypothetical protein ACO22W_00980 [Steroidobacteraceae bacterium]